MGPVKCTALREFVTLSPDQYCLPSFGLFAFPNDFRWQAAVNRDGDWVVAPRAEFRERQGGLRDGTPSRLDDSLG